MEAQQQTKWFNKKWIAIFFSLTLFPIGLFVLWKNQSLKRTWKVVIALCSPFSTALLIIMIPVINYLIAVKVNVDSINVEEKILSEKVDSLLKGVPDLGAFADFIRLEQRASVLKEQNKLDSAIILYEKAIQLPVPNKHKVEAYNGIGECYMLQEKINLSLKYFKLATACDSSKYTSFKNQGKTYYFLEQDRTAIEKYTLAIQRKCPPEEGIYGLRGLCYRELKNYDLAIYDFDMHIRSNPKKAIAYADRGRCYKELSKWNLAIEDFKAAISLDPQNEEFQKEYRLAKQFANFKN